MAIAVSRENRPVSVMTDHPGWETCGLRAARLLASEDVQLVVLDQDGSLAGCGGGRQLLPDIFELDGSATDSSSGLREVLGGLGSVSRFRNPSLWDALGTAVIRQVIRAGHARAMYRRFCQAFGEPVVIDGDSTLWLFPSPEVVLALTDADFDSLGMAFKRRPLRAAAAAFEEHEAEWTRMETATLVAELQTVPGIGTWTAGAAVADWTNDWSVYPHGDLAVRTWAQAAAPDHPWPQDEKAFAAYWRKIAGDDLSALTVLTLAWGNQNGRART